MTEPVKTAETTTKLSTPSIAPKKTFTKPSYKPGQNSNKTRRGKKTFKRTGPSLPVVSRSPVKSYLSTCCQAPATKPVAGKPRGASEKDAPVGLGKWRCGICRKACKVTAGAPTAVEVACQIGTPPVE